MPQKSMLEDEHDEGGVYHRMDKMPPGFLDDHFTSEEQNMLLDLGPPGTIENWRHWNGDKGQWVDGRMPGHEEAEKDPVLR